MLDKKTTKLRSEQSFQPFSKTNHNSMASKKCDINSMFLPKEDCVKADLMGK